jgi:hypothetical protein
MPDSAAPTSSDGGTPWLGVALVVGTAVAVAYLFTHPYPAYGAGLYLEIADQIVAHGYRLPETIPHYTDRGVPFAYPPLVFYAAAVVVDVTPVDPLALSRYAPPLLTVLYLIPYYFVARELLGDRTEAGVATTLLAVTPPVLQWHLSAGGLVRSTAFLITLTGLYTGIRLFRSGERRWLLASTLLFGLAVLSHPVYTVFFGLSYLLLYLHLDRSLRGLLRGAAVALGGLLLSMPWWLSVARAHGIGVFTAAAGTHTGLFGGVDRLLDQFVYPLVTSVPVPLFFLLAFGGGFYLLGRRRPFLPAWLVAAAVVIGKARFQFVPGSMMAAVFLLAMARAFAREYFPAREWRRAADVADATRVAVAAVVLVAVVVGVMFGGAALPQAHHGSPSQPQFMTHTDADAMAWAVTNTAPSSEFVVLGDAAEWFPLLTNRTILVGPWGVEWRSPDRYQRQLSLFKTLSTCDSERCVTANLRRANLCPDYLYVPKGSYTVRGLHRRNTTELRQALTRSDRFRLVYGNAGAAVYRVDYDSGAARCRASPS